MSYEGRLRSAARVIRIKKSQSRLGRPSIPPLATRLNVQSERALCEAGKRGPEDCCGYVENRSLELVLQESFTMHDAQNTFRKREHLLVYEIGAGSRNEARVSKNIVVDVKSQDGTALLPPHKATYSLRGSIRISVGA